MEITKKGKNINNIKWYQPSGGQLRITVWKLLSSSPNSVWCVANALQTATVSASPEHKSHLSPHVAGRRWAFVRQGTLDQDLPGCLLLMGTGRARGRCCSLQWRPWRSSKSACLNWNPQSFRVPISVSDVIVLWVTHVRSPGPFLASSLLLWATSSSRSVESPFLQRLESSSSSYVHLPGRLHNPSCFWLVHLQNDDRVPLESQSFPHTAVERVILTDQYDNAPPLLQILPWPLPGPGKKVTSPIPVCEPPVLTNLPDFLLPHPPPVLCSSHQRTPLCLSLTGHSPLPGTPSLVFLIKSPSFLKARLTVTCPETLTPSLSPLVWRNTSLCSHSSLSCSPYHTAWLLWMDFQPPRLHCELHSNCQDEALSIWSRGTRDRASNKANDHKMLNKWMKMMTELINCKGKVLSSQKNQYEATRGHIGNSLPIGCY